MQQSFSKKLSFYIWKTNITSQKIDGNRPKIFNIVIIFLLIDNKHKKSWFFRKTFLFIDINIDVIFGIYFLN